MLAATKMGNLPAYGGWETCLPTADEKSAVGSEQLAAPPTPGYGR